MIESEDIDTIGGWFFAHNLGAELGTVMNYYDHELILVEKDGQRIKRLKIIKPKN